MTNTYDILVNFKRKAYEFYEWEKEDLVKHIKKIPTFKVNEKIVDDFLNNNVCVSKEFLKNIKEKTEVFTNRVITAIDYACILFCDEVCFAFMFDKEGNIIGRSKLLFDESDDVILKGKEKHEYNIKYDIISNIKNDGYFTRKEKKLMNILINYLDNIYIKKEYDEIKYIHFECFDTYIEDEKTSYLNLIDGIKNGDFKMIDKLKEVLKVLKK